MYFYSIDRKFTQTLNNYSFKTIDLKHNSNDSSIDITFCYFKNEFI
jgi:hypothetical protein